MQHEAALDSEQVGELEIGELVRVDLVQVRHGGRSVLGCLTAHSGAFASVFCC